MLKEATVTVGRSVYTAAKHSILNALLGKTVGVLTKMPSRSYNWAPSACHLVDLTAGDGAVCDEYASSPAIMLKHANWLHPRWKGRELTVTFVEKAPRTFHELTENVKGYQGSVAPDLLNIDSSEFGTGCWQEDSSLFLNVDPNSIHGMPKMDRLLRLLPKHSLAMVSMGCNVAGIKRLSPDLRQQWFEYVHDFVSVLPEWHDVLILALHGKDRWGYLLRIPKVWSRDFQGTIRKVVAKAWEGTFQVEACRDSTGGFECVLDYLFRTKKELENGGAA